jgi:hypothetical protein
VVLLPIVLVGTGCQREIPYGEVEGVVTLNGKPLTDVEVVFLPDPDKGTQGRRSVSLTDKEGRYRITSDTGRAGAPVGFHRVCIIDMLSPPWAPVAVMPGEGSKGGAPAGMKEPPGMKAVAAGGDNQKRSRFPSVYGNANSTPLRDVEVKDGTQTINFELKREKP